jgi:hypothetical protein
MMQVYLQCCGIIHVLERQKVDACIVLAQMSSHARYTLYINFSKKVDAREGISLKHTRIIEAHTNTRSHHFSERFGIEEQTDRQNTNTGFMPVNLCDPLPSESVIRVQNPEHCACCC